jgi:sirohydrochlorin ferrochelatase
VPLSARAVLRPVLWIALGAWLGAMLFFGAVVARATFEVIPSADLAGQLVGRVLAPLQLGGAAVGIALSALGGALGRGRVAVLLPLLLALVCLVNHFGVTPAVAEIRLGRLADAGADPGMAQRFARLHLLSVSLFMVTASGAVLLAVVHALAEAREGTGAGVPHL